jgi:tRNA/tmRNA/rRNA uracil-C5-methylase (TrmA/RlmC/RlmD family)
MAQLRLEVESVAHGGFCIARHEGRVVFVRHALPGEVVLAEVTEDIPGKSFMRADAVEIVEPSPHRVEPPCRYAGPGKCGGCDFQHATLAHQREMKAAVVREQLERLAGLSVDVTVEAVDEDGLDWRTRVEYAVGDDGRAGLRKSRSRDVIAIDECLIAHPLVEEVGAHRRSYDDLLSVEVIASVGTEDRAVVVTPKPRVTDPSIPSFDVPTAVLASDGHKSLPTVRALQGRPGVREEAVERTWRVSGSGFWQVHPRAAETLSAAVLDALQPRLGEYAIDLYCGVGLFAGAIAPHLGPGGRITAIEADTGAAEDARFNLRDVEGQVRVETGRVEKVLLTSGIRACDLVVLDPPRSGAGRPVTEWICSLRPRAMVYVACDPSSLARDLRFADANGYKLTSLRAFDLFPMTQHVECVAVLEPH